MSRFRKLPEDVRRQQILDAALRAFASDGYDKVTVARVAREAGLTKGGVYFHFTSKEELFTSMVEAELDRRWGLARELAGQVAELPPLDAVRAVFHWWLELEQRVSILTPAIIATCIAMDRPREAFMAQVERVTGLMAETLARPLADLNVGVEPRDLAEMLMVFRVGAIWKQATSAPDERERFHANVVGMIGRLLTVVGAGEAAR